MDQCYVTALDRLRENHHRLDSLAKALLASETLDEHDAYAAAGFDRHRRRPSRPLRSEEAEDEIDG